MAAIEKVKVVVLGDSGKLSVANYFFSLSAHVCQ